LLKKYLGTFLFYFLTNLLVSSKELIEKNLILAKISKKRQKLAKAMSCKGDKI